MLREEVIQTMLLLHLLGRLPAKETCQAAESHTGCVKATAPSSYLRGVRSGGTLGQAQVLPSRALHPKGLVLGHKEGGGGAGDEVPP